MSVSVTRKPFTRATLFGLCCAALCAALLSTRDEHLVLEVDLNATEAGVAQIFYAADGAFSEPNSATARVAAGENRLAFGLPRARYTSLRFDPIDGDSTVTITAWRLKDDRGDYRELPLALIFPDSGFAAVERSPSRIQATPIPGTNDPQMRIADGFPWESLTEDRNLQVSDFFVSVVAGLIGVVVWTLASAQRVAITSVVTVGMSIAAVLIATLATRGPTDVSVHPDEFNHHAAVDYYRSHWLPPAVDSDTVVPTLSVYGASYLFELDVVYWLVARLTAPLADAFHDDDGVVTARLFNVGLWLGLLAVGIAWPAASITFAITLISPQVWYVFAYMNGDAFPLFLSLVAASLVAVPKSPVVEYVLSRGRFGAGPLILSVCLALLLVSKRNYLPLVPLFVLWLGIRANVVAWPVLLGTTLGGTMLATAALMRSAPATMISTTHLAAAGIALLLIAAAALIAVYAQKPRQRSAINRIGAIALVAAVCVVPRYALDLWINGTPTEKSGRIAAVIEEHADDRFKPSRLLSTESYFGLGLAAKGVEFAEIFREPLDWDRQALRSAFGVYGYMNVFAPPWIYDLLMTLTSVLALTAVFTLRPFKSSLKMLTLGSGVVLQVFLIAALHSWINDFQAQGRYLMPALIVVSMFLSNLTNENRIAPVVKILLILATSVAAASFALYALPHFIRAP